MMILNWIFCFLFLLSAVLQFNDPDSVQWMLMWGAAGGACLLFGLGKLPRWFPFTVGMIAVAWGLYLFPKILGHLADIRWNEVFMQAKMSNLTVEYVREFGGLLMIAVWMVVLVIRRRKPD